MIVVDYCPTCGMPIFGSVHADDPMADVRFASCSCADDDNLDYDCEDHIIGSGDFNGWSCGR